MSTCFYDPLSNVSPSLMICWPFVVGFNSESANNFSLRNLIYITDF